MKYKKSVEQRKWIRKLPIAFETYEYKMLNGDTRTSSRPCIKHARFGQIYQYYKRKLDGFGLSAKKLRDELTIDALAGIALGALSKDILFNGDDDIK